ncbi:helix-turn-helix domain-containing protein [Nanoarchaeota archaeon]
MQPKPLVDEETTPDWLSYVQGDTLKERFDTLLLARGMRQVDLADAIGVSRSFLNMIIHQKVQPSPKLRVKIAEKLKVDSYVLWRDFG